VALSSADKKARDRFQSGLLAWLRAEPEAAASAGGLREMIAVARGRIEEDAANALLWRSTEALLKALLDGSLQTDEEARQLCRRIERQLAGRSDDAMLLGDAIFAFVSNRCGAPTAAESIVPPAPAGPSAETTSAGKPARPLHDALGATADLLPLLGDKRRRFSGEQHARWQDIAQRLHEDWHAQLTGSNVSCRGDATQLVALALELNEPAALALGEAIADTAAACEDRSNLETPMLRAAFSAALEILASPEGPEQRAFADQARQSTQRLQRALIAARRKPSSPTRPPWFADDAHEWLAEMRAALDAVPPKRLTLLAGLDWLAQQGGGSGKALRDLATVAGKLVRQTRGDDLDDAERYRLLGEVLDSLTAAVDDLAAGRPARPDEAVVARVRALEQEVTRPRVARKDAKPGADRADAAATGKILVSDPARPDDDSANTVKLSPPARQP
jgi:hypothetical protein